MVHPSLLRIALLLLPIVLAAQEPISFSKSSPEALEATFKQVTQHSIEAQQKKYGVPGVSLLLIENGRISWAKQYGYRQSGKQYRINRETMFSVGSISKVVSAITALRLVDGGKLDLDEDINGYLTRWKVPRNKFTEERVATLRKILSHTAGFTVHGFADYQPNEPLPDLLEIIHGKHPAKNGPIYINAPIGAQERYSGGGTTVVQLIIEDVMDESFSQIAKELVFDPMQLTRTTFSNPLPQSYSNVAKAHGPNGRPRALPRGYESMPELAASGLWTTPSDLAQILLAVVSSYQGNSNEILSRELTQEMMEPVPPSHYGLGPEIKKTGSSKIMYHGGANDSYRARFEIDLDQQNGFIIFTNGERGSELIWEFVKAIKQLIRWTAND
ncbi:MAG: hypothetical protein Tsb004_28170 [Allomuricauda sp.]